MSNQSLDEIALLVAQRGCVVLREQKFIDVGFQEQKRIASYFGPLHKHGWMPHPKNGPIEFVIVYDSAVDLRIRKSWARKSPIQFHVDQSPESGRDSISGRYESVISDGHCVTPNTPLKMRIITRAIYYCLRSTAVFN